MKVNEEVSDKVLAITIQINFYTCSILK